MFTGLVAERGRLTAAPTPSGQGGRRLELMHSLELSERLSLGASLAVSGVCLTVTDFSPGRTVVELSPETLSRTTLGDLDARDEVNLEPALRMGDPLGGHWVQGHVDTTVEVVDRRDLEQHRVLFFSLPEELGPFLVEKGSVTLDGVSLTVAALEVAASEVAALEEGPDGVGKAERFSVALIPHTLEITTLSNLQVGQRVNLEIDVLAKYVQQALAARGVTG